MRQPAIGANLWIWESPVTTDVIRRHAPRLAEWGFDMIELPVEYLEAWDPADIRPLLEEHGLNACVCAVMPKPRSLSTWDTYAVLGSQSYMKACIDKAATLDADVVAGPIYDWTGNTGAIPPEFRAELVQRLVKNLQPVLDHAASTGVRLAIEPLNRFETSLFNTVEQTMELIQKVDHPSLGLLLDTFHMNIEERDVGAAIQLAGDRLFHFHACGNDRGAPGGDNIDWQSIREALGDIGYDGAVSIESFTSANQTIATAASIWRPLAQSQDDIAVDGLAFLNSLFETSR